MEPVRAALRLSNPLCPAVEEWEVTALVEADFMYVCIPRELAQKLQLTVVGQREVQAADGTFQLIDYAGPIRVAMFGRSSFTGALICGDQVVFGAIPMTDMDLVVDRRRQLVTVHPDSPDVARSIVKRAA